MDSYDQTREERTTPYSYEIYERRNVQKSGKKQERGVAKEIVRTFAGGQRRYLFS